MRVGARSCRSARESGLSGQLSPTCRVQVNNTQVKFRTGFSLPTQREQPHWSHLVLRIVGWDGGGSGNIIGCVEQSSCDLNTKFNMY